MAVLFDWDIPRFDVLNGGTVVVSGLNFFLRKSNFVVIPFHMHGFFPHLNSTTLMSDMSQGRLESFGCDSSPVRFFKSVHAGATIFAFLSSMRSMKSLKFITFFYFLFAALNEYSITQ